MNEIVTIITPTYNRCDKLKKLYKSLISQHDKRFVWLVIDDGSVDNTEQFFHKINEKQFSVQYIKKENGGKHTALNLAFDNLRTDLACIVDSDDYLVPTAIREIINDWEKYKHLDNIGGLCYLKKDDTTQKTSTLFLNKEKIANYNTYIINNNIVGENFEIFRSDILKKHKFPIYENEKFIGEGVLWSIIAHEYDMVFFNKALYCFEYLENGLTQNGRKMRLMNPLGGAFHAFEYLDRRYCFKIREKNALLYLTYSLFAKKNILKIVFKSNFKFLLFVNIFPSLLLFCYWKIKYRGEKK